MTSLKNDYLYSYILNFILSYNYICTFLNYPFTIFTYSETEFKHLNDETINYALVSKKFFQLTKNELRRVCKFKNFECLKFFMNYNGLYRFKLIDQKDSIMQYQTMKEYSYQDRAISSKFKKVLVKEMDAYKTQELLLSSEVYPSNVQFELNIFISDQEFPLAHKDYNCKANPLYSFSFYKSQFHRILQMPAKRIYSINIMERAINREEDSEIILSNINKLGAKQVFYRPNSQEVFFNDWMHQGHFAPLFSSPNYKRVSIAFCLYYPHDYLSITPSLKNLSIIFDFNRLNYHNSMDPSKSLENDWNQLVDNLLGSQSVKYLEIVNQPLTKHGQLEEEEEDLAIKKLNYNNTQQSFYLNGLYKLFSSPKCSIQRLEINQFRIERENTLLLGGLLLNTSIKTVIFYQSRSVEFFEEVLFKQQQKSIRNIIILDAQEKELFEILRLLKSRVESLYLYSITFETDMGLSLDVVNKVIDKINKYNYSIKEYNFYIQNNQVVNNSIILLENGSIVNLRKVSQDEYEPKVQIEDENEIQLNLNLNQD